MAGNKQSHLGYSGISTFNMKGIKAALKIPPVPTNIKDTSNNTITWGQFNDEPFKIVETLKRSITGQACAETLQRYIYGNGCSDQDLGNLMINDNQTLNNLIWEISGQLAKLFGFTINTKYRGDGKIGKLYMLPFEGHRLKMPADTEMYGVTDAIKYNPYFGTADYKQQYTKEFPLFNPDTVQEDFNNYGGEYNGQVYRAIIEQEYNRFYPNPQWWADNQGRGNGKDAMESEYLLQRLLNKELDHGFLQNVVMKVVGDPNAPIPDHKERAANGQTYTTVGEELNNYLNGEFSGVEGASMMVYWAQLSEDFPSIEAFPNNFNYDKLKDVRDIVKQDIATAWGVPLILANIQTTGAISKDDIQSAVNLMHGKVRYYQHMIESSLNNILAYWNVSVKQVKLTNYNPFPNQKDLPDKVWEVMTVEEKREWVSENTDVNIDLTPSSEEEEEEQSGFSEEQMIAQANLRGSVGGVQGILEIANNFKQGIITESSAISILIEIFGFERVTAEKILDTQDNSDSLSMELDKVNKNLEDINFE